ncbi:MFS transporter [Roseiflexus sp.]|uniref:MFS transporter n=1 Tax=Roseiflexus sp. TaxID=2562120 RepID=UPI0025D8C729|nr:MFS transporter [Roseiflexus sp.]
MSAFYIVVPMKLLSDTARERSVWANRDFLYLWGATVISQLGTQITFLGLPFLAVTMLNATPLQTSVLATLGWVPVVALGFVAGAIIDRGRRQPVLIWCDVARAVVLLTIPIACLFGGLSLWQLYAVVLLTGVFSTFFDTAYQARVPSLVPAGQLVAANSGLEIAQSGTRIVGPGLAGALIALLTAPLAILLDALSYLLSALLLLGIRAPETVSDMPPLGTRANRPLRVDIKEGLVFFWREPLLRSLVGCTVLMSVGWALVEGIFLFYLIRTLGLDAGLTGVIFSVGNVGLLVAAAVTGRLVGRWELGPVVGSAVVLHAGGILLIALAPLAPLPFLITGYLVRAAAVVAYNISQVTIRQCVTPSQMLGRVTATARVISWSSIPSGLIIGGLLATAIGLQTTIWTGALLSCCACIPMILGGVWRVRRLSVPSAL